MDYQKHYRETHREQRKKYLEDNKEKIQQQKNLYYERTLYKKRYEKMMETKKQLERYNINT
jgi:hypothetical protein